MRYGLALLCLLLAPLAAGEGHAGKPSVLVLSDQPRADLQQRCDTLLRLRDMAESQSRNGQDARSRDYWAQQKRRHELDMRRLSCMY
ncbi:hypothetical protein ABWL39_10950 [Chitinivorax sp. PXF-14]|uniref:hypothetical protein n=1 Tax=Chitinivorax sp. PXF-14 TaxID=3230488 RepID=UPI003465F4BF